MCGRCCRLSRARARLHQTQYPAACNAAETLLVHVDCAKSGLLSRLGQALAGRGVQIRACERSFPFLSSAGAVLASATDFDTEFVDMVMAVKMVDSMAEAIEHINRHGSRHTDAIITQSDAAAEHFMAQVDSAGVYHNASTRFADGYRYGFGAEIGVSTNKTHARGPVGLDGLIIYKYRLYGRGHCVADYGANSFKHLPLPPEQQRRL